MQQKIKVRDTIFVEYRSRRLCNEGNNHKEKYYGQMEEYRETYFILHTRIQYAVVGYAADGGSGRGSD